MIARSLFTASGLLAGLWLWLVLVPLPSSPESRSGKPETIQQSKALLFPQPASGTNPDRPLFHPIPPPRPVAVRPPPMLPAPVAPAPEKKLRLVGVIEEKGDRVAFLHVEGEQDARRIISGQVVEGWQVTVIGLRGIELTRGTARNVLHLDPPKSP